MTYGKLDMRRPDMKNASDEVEPFLKRERTPEKEVDWGMWAVFAAIVLMFAAALFADKVGLVGGIFAEKAQAEELPPTQEEFCKDLQENGGFLFQGHMGDTVKLCAKLGITI